MLLKKTFFSRFSYFHSLLLLYSFYAILRQTHFEASLDLRAQNLITWQQGRSLIGIFMEDEDI